MYSPASSKVTLRKDRTSSSLSVVLAPAVYKERTERDRRAPRAAHGHRSQSPLGAAPARLQGKRRCHHRDRRHRGPVASAPRVHTEPEASPSTGESSVPGEPDVLAVSTAGRVSVHRGKGAGGGARGAGREATRPGRSEQPWEPGPERGGNREMDRQRETARVLEQLEAGAQARPQGKGVRGHTQGAGGSAQAVGDQSRRSQRRPGGSRCRGGHARSSVSQGRGAGVAGRAGGHRARASELELGVPGRRGTELLPAGGP